MSQPQVTPLLRISTPLGQSQNNNLLGEFVQTSEPVAQAESIALVAVEMEPTEFINPVQKSSPPSQQMRDTRVSHATSSSSGSSSGSGSNDCCNDWFFWWCCINANCNDNNSKDSCSCCSCNDDCCKDCNSCCDCDCDCDCGDCDCDCDNGGGN
jgi:hypothetical protein